RLGNHPGLTSFGHPSSLRRGGSSARQILLPRCFDFRDGLLQRSLESVFEVVVLRHQVEDGVDGRFSGFTYDEFHDRQAFCVGYIRRGGGQSDKRLVEVLQRRELLFLKEPRKSFSVLRSGLSLLKLRHTFVEPGRTAASGQSVDERMREFVCERCC